MKKIFATLIINGVCLYIIDWLFTGVSLTPKALVLVSVLLWVLNLCVKPILQVISLPLTILTLEVVLLYYQCDHSLVIVQTDPGRLLQ